MPVDKFGRTTSSGDSTSGISPGITMGQVNEIFLRRDGENVATNDINLDSHKLINVANPTNDKDAANKEYVDSNAGLNAVSKSGDVMTGDLLLMPGEDSNRRVLGCIHLALGKIFTVALGSRENRFDYTDQRPVTLETSNGLLIRAREDSVCRIGPSAIGVYKNIEMNSNRILYLTDPEYPHEAVSKSYVDRKVLDRPLLSYEGHIPSLERAVSKTGFIVSASSRFDIKHLPYFAFSSGKSEWATSREGVGAWIQIICPTSVRIWKIRLTGRKSNAERITSWKLSGGTVTSGRLTDIHTSESTLGSQMQEFEINAHRAYSIYRLTVLSVESGTNNTGLSYFQIYIQSY